MEIGYIAIVIGLGILGYALYKIIKNWNSK